MTSEESERIQQPTLAGTDWRLEQPSPWRDERLLNELYVEQRLDTVDIAEKLGCSSGTVSRWIRKLGVKRPWRDEELMRELYEDKLFSSIQISEHLDCSNATVHTWLEQHGIEKRTRSEAAQNMHGYLHHAAYYTKQSGREIWKHKKQAVFVHRLVAVAKFGFEAVRDMAVHHKNEIPWDNRPENIELVTNEEHPRKHLKIDGIDRIRVAEMYEHGDISSRNLASMFDVTGGTVLDIHNEFYGGCS